MLQARVPAGLQPPARRPPPDTPTMLPAGPPLLPAGTSATTSPCSFPTASSAWVAPPCCCQTSEEAQTALPRPGRRLWLGKSPSQVLVRTCACMRSACAPASFSAMRRAPPPPPPGHAAAGAPTAGGPSTSCCTWCAPTWGRTTRTTAACTKRRTAPASRVRPPPALPRLFSEAGSAPAARLPQGQ